MQDELDRQKRLYWVQRTVRIYGLKLQPFVVVINHDHLFVETPDPNLSEGTVGTKGMQYRDIPIPAVSVRRVVASNPAPKR